MECRFYDTTSGRFFNSSKEVIEEACRKVNEQVKAKEIISWSDAMDELYRLLGFDVPLCVMWPPKGDYLMEWDEVEPLEVSENTFAVKKGTNEALKSLIVSHMLFQAKLNELNKAYSELEQKFEDYKKGL